VDIEDIVDLDPAKVCVISTGSQGEPMSALSLMASSDNRWIKVGPEDTVILSSHPIPGNEASVSKIIDGMTRLGAEVIHSGIDAVHATGHAKQEELKTLLSIAQPDWFTPVHGEYRHLTSHARLAHSMGMTDDRVLVCEDGDQLLLTDLGVTRGQEVPAGYLYVDGIVGDVGQGVLRDRRVLAEEGVVVVVVTVDARTGAIVTGPEVITRGWVYAPEAEDLIDECADEVRAAVQESFKSGDPADIEALQRVVRKTAGRFVADRTRRRPMIVPVVMET
jgi:ribonuclease J